MSLHCLPRKNPSQVAPQVSPASQMERPPARSALELIREHLGRRARALKGQGFDPLSMTPRRGPVGAK